MLVFGFHVGTMGFIDQPQTQAAVSWLFTLGLSGVQFFFILSGFVLVWSARPGDSRRAFWRRRAAKIFPNHVVLWAVVLLLGVYWAQPFDLRVALPNLFLLQAWDPFAFYTVNNVSWSLSCEIFFYLCLPLALPTIRRMPPWLLWGIVVAVPLLILSLWPAQALVPEVHRWWFTQIFPPVRSLEFWMGVAAAELMLRGRWRGPGLRLATLIFVGAWLIAAQWIPAEFWAALLAAVYILVIAAAADADVRGLPSPWRSRTLVWLGEISFAYYLLHVFVIATVLRFIGRSDGLPGWWGPVAAIGFLLLNVLLAGLLHRYVETPMMRLLTPRRPSSPPPPPSPSPSPPSPPSPSRSPATSRLLLPQQSRRQ